MSDKKPSCRMRLRSKGSQIQLNLLLPHPMETDNRKDPDTGLKLRRNYTRELRIRRNGVEVCRMDCNWGLADNPLMSFFLDSPEAGDRFDLDWTDNSNRTFQANATYA